MAVYFLMPETLVMQSLYEAQNIVQKYVNTNTSSYTSSIACDIACFKIPFIMQLTVSTCCHNI